MNDDEPNCGIQVDGRSANSLVAIPVQPGVRYYYAMINAFSPDTQGTYTLNWRWSPISGSIAPPTPDPDPDVTPSPTTPLTATPPSTATRTGTRTPRPTPSVTGTAARTGFGEDSILLIKLGGPAYASAGEGTALPVIVEERAPANGALRKSLAVPVARDGLMAPCTLSYGSSNPAWKWNEEGIPSLAGDGSMVTFPCYNRPPGTPLAVSDDKVVASIEYEAWIDTSAVFFGFNGQPNSTHPQALRTAAAQNDASGFYVGGTGGTALYHGVKWVRPVSSGASYNPVYISGRVADGPGYADVRYLSAHNGVLHGISSPADGANVTGLWSFFGSGLPQLYQWSGVGALPGFGRNATSAPFLASPYSYVLQDGDTPSTSLVLWMATDHARASYNVLPWMRDPFTGIWSPLTSAAVSFSTTEAVYSITGDYSNVTGAFQLYAVTRTTLYRYDTTTRDPPVVLSSAGPGEYYRGVALAPWYPIPPSITPTASKSPGASPSGTGTMTRSGSNTATVSVTASASPASATGTVTPTSPATATSTGTDTATVTITSTASVTISISGTGTQTSSSGSAPSLSPSSTVSSSYSSSDTETASVTATVTASATVSASYSSTPTGSISGGSAPSITATETGTASITASGTLAAGSPGATSSVSASGTPPATVSPTSSLSLGGTPSGSMSISWSATMPPSSSGTSSNPPTPPGTPPNTPSSTSAAPPTGTPPGTPPPTSSASITASITPSHTAPASRTATRSPTTSITSTLTRGASASATPSYPPPDRVTIRTAIKVATAYPLTLSRTDVARQLRADWVCFTNASYVSGTSRGVMVWVEAIQDLNNGAWTNFTDEEGTVIDAAAHALVNESPNPATSSCDVAIAVRRQLEANDVSSSGSGGGRRLDEMSSAGSIVIVRLLIDPPSLSQLDIDAGLYHGYEAPADFWYTIQYRRQLAKAQAVTSLLSGVVGTGTDVTGSPQLMSGLSLFRGKVSEYNYVAGGAVILRLPSPPTVAYPPQRLSTLVSIRPVPLSPGPPPPDRTTSIAVGAVLGGVVAIGMAGFVAWLLVAKRRSQKAKVRSVVVTTLDDYLKYAIVKQGPKAQLEQAAATVAPTLSRNIIQKAAETKVSDSVSWGTAGADELQGRQMMANANPLAPEYHLPAEAQTKIATFDAQYAMPPPPPPIWMAGHPQQQQQLPPPPPPVPVEARVSFRPMRPSATAANVALGYGLAIDQPQGMMMMGGVGGQMGGEVDYASPMHPHHHHSHSHHSHRSSNSIGTTASGRFIPPPPPNALGITAVPMALMPASAGGLAATATPVGREAIPMGHGLMVGHASAAMTSVGGSNPLLSPRPVSGIPAMASPTASVHVGISGGGGIPASASAYHSIHHHHHSHSHLQSPSAASVASSVTLAHSPSRQGEKDVYSNPILQQHGGAATEGSKGSDSHHSHPHHHSGSSGGHISGSGSYSNPIAGGGGGGGHAEPARPKVRSTIGSVTSAPVVPVPPPKHKKHHRSEEEEQDEQQQEGSHKRLHHGSHHSHGSSSGGSSDRHHHGSHKRKSSRDDGHDEEERGSNPLLSKAHSSSSGSAQPRPPAGSSSRAASASASGRHGTSASRLVDDNEDGTFSGQSGFAASARQGRR